MGMKFPECTTAMKEQQGSDKVSYNVYSLLTELKSCAIKRDLHWGRKIHLKAIESQNDSKMFVLTALIRMYGKCGSMVDAHGLFDSIQNPDPVSWTALLWGYAENKDGVATLDLFSKMKSAGSALDSVAYVAAFKGCMALATQQGVDGEGECLKRGREIHSEIGGELNIFVQNTLIDMYATCGSMAEARSVFDNIQRPDVVSWTTLLLGYAENGDELATLHLFSKMKAHGCAPDSLTYVAGLKACSSLAGRDGNEKTVCLKRGREIHSEIGCKLNIFLQSALINMYAKCGSMVEARSVFDNTQKPGVVSWTALLLGYADNGEGLEALELFSEMKACRCAPNSLTYVAALKACTAVAVKRDIYGRRELLKRGKMIHSVIGCDLDIYVQSTLVDMYAKCSSMVEAHSVFVSIQNPDVVSWNALLLGYTENGEGAYALEMFWLMKSHGCSRDSLTYVAALKACMSLAGQRAGDGQVESLKLGRQIHSEIGCDLNSFLQSTLIEMYVKCGSMLDACSIFYSIQDPDVASWNALLLGYAEKGDWLATWELFSKMKAFGCACTSLTYVAALKACTSFAVKRNDGGEFLKWGREIHSEIGCHMNIFVQSTLIDMYAKYGCMEDARSVFERIQKPDVVSWNALLMGYAENGEGISTVQLFSRMKAGGCVPDSITYVSALKACTCMAVNADDRQKKDWLERGRDIHSEIICMLDIVVQNTLIDMYAKCGSMIEARSVFDSIKKHDLVSWNALIQGYAENGEGPTALELFWRMKSCGCTANSVTYIAALKACSSFSGKREQIEYLKRGREIHSEIGCDINASVQSILIDMYARFGSMVESRSVFDSIQMPDVVSWTALLLGYVENGDALATLDLFSKMKACGCAPDSVTYVVVLKACGLIGALALGRKLHSDINSSEFTAHLVTVLVDFYAKCGSMIEACEVFHLHSTARIVPTWNALLSGYGSFGDTSCVLKLFQKMQDESFPPDAVTFVCLLSCCSHAGLVEKAWEYFEGMPMKYGVTPTLMHYTCMVDVLGRANQLNEAIAMLQKMPCSPDAVTWMTLLGACHKWKNVEIGRYAFQSLVGIDKKNVPAYVLMAQIYGSKGMWQEQERVLEAKVNWIEVGIKNSPEEQFPENVRSC